VVEVGGYEPGSFCFMESGSVDVESSSRFYEAFLGWQAERRLSSEGSSYTRFFKDGGPVGGMYGVSADQDTAAVPRRWLTYVSVDDAEATLEKAVALGAAPFGDVVKVPGVVTVAEFLDPEGAVCGLWQSATHIGASYVDEPSALSWSDLLTSDADAAASFYGEVFGWTTEEFSSHTYRFFSASGTLRGGMSVVGAETGKPPQWRAHIGVSGLDEAVAAAVELGARVKSALTNVPGIGRRQEIEDPVGISFSLIEITPPDAQDARTYRHI
jgi:predicted enzyme related to lactoylglutathione lyase